jgi:hypothetical protein
MAVPTETKRENEETLEAFMIVMGLSFMPVLFSFIGMLLVDSGWIHVAGYNENGFEVGSLRKGLSQGMRVVLAFGAVGFIIPTIYSLCVLLRHRRREPEA